MNRSRRHLLIALLLPLLVLRALLPAGYMADTQAGGFQLVMCSEGLLQPDTGDGHDADAGLCLFAHAAQVAVPAAPFVFPAVASIALSRPDVGHLLAPTTGPPRTDRARGPPTYS